MMQNSWKPNKWAAAGLSFLAAPLGMLYVARIGLAVLYLLLLVSIGFMQYWLDTKGYSFPLYYVLAVVAIIHAYHIAARAHDIDPRPWHSRWYGLLLVAATMIVSVILFRVFLFEPYRVPSQSMVPSIPGQSYVWVKKLGYGNYAGYGMRLARGEVSVPINRGDVLAFEYPRDRTTHYVMRVIGLPGDDVVYRDKQLIVNGKRLSVAPFGAHDQLRIANEENYLIAHEPGLPAKDFNAKIEPGHLFVLGDNRDNASDSRYWGQVPYDHVVGKVVLVLKNEETTPAVTTDQPQTSSR